MAEAVGLIVAAIIAGLVAFLGLVISKEQSVSEFRQQWIDELRKDIAIIVGCVTRIHGESIAGHNNQTLWDKVKVDFTRFNRVIVRIRLRLNPAEKRGKEEQATKAVLDALKELESIFGSKEPQFHRLQPLVETLVTNSQTILKENWDRVREGEPTYQKAKSNAVTFTIVLTVAGVITYGIYLFKTICY
jgi:hypothetical protein